MMYGQKAALTHITYSEGGVCDFKIFSVIEHFCEEKKHIRPKLLFKAEHFYTSKTCLGVNVSYFKFSYS